MPPTMSRRQFLLSLSGLGLGLTGYGHFLETEWLELNRVTIPLWNDGGTPVRVLHLSDLHASAYVSYDYLADAFAMGLAERPDLIVLTGDYVTHRLDEADRYAALLTRLATAAPTVAVYGNHDGGRWAVRRGGYPDTGAVGRLLRTAGITVLENTGTTLRIGGRVLRLVGTADLWSGRFDPDSAFGPDDGAGDETVILLAHNPDSKDRLRDRPWRLMLSGHTHGGQIRLPLLDTAPFAPVRDGRFVEGLHEWEGRWLYVTRGVGNVRGFRFNCRPQVSIVTLR